MKIGIMADEIAPGSAPKIIGQEVRGLRALGHECEGIAIIRRDYWQRFPDVYDYHLDGVPIRYLFDEFPRPVKAFNFKIPGFSFFSMHHLSSPIFAPGNIKEKEWDILLAYCPYVGFTARQLYKKRGIPYLQYIWDPVAYTLAKSYANRKMRYLFPILLPMASYVDKYVFKDCLAVITSGKLHHSRLRKLTDKNLEILYPGCVPAEQFPPFESREDMLLTFERWDIANIGLITGLLGILDRLSRKVKFVIAGFWHPPALREYFIREVERKGVSDQVQIIGALNEKQIIELCSKAKVHVHPDEESFGMPTLEAAACGCPIIVPENSGVTELFQHGVHGYFPKRGDVDEYAEYVDRIISNPAQAKEMSYEAWQTAKKHSWKEHASKLEEIIMKYVK